MMQIKKIGVLVFMLVIGGVLLGSATDAMAQEPGQACSPNDKPRACADIPPKGFYTCVEKDNNSPGREYSCQCRWGNLEAGWGSLFSNSTGTISVCELYEKEVNLPTSNNRGAIILLFIMLDKITAIIIALTVMAAMVMIVVGGYLYMTAGGNADQVRKAKMWIGSSIAGIFLAVLSFTILRLIASNLVDFS